MKLPIFQLQIREIFQSGYEEANTKHITRFGRRNLPLVRNMERFSNTPSKKVYPIGNEDFCRLRYPLVCRIISLGDF